MTEDDLTGTIVEFKPETMIRCPCGQWCLIGRDQTGAPGVLHEEPMCDQFLRLDVVRFVVYLRHYYEQQARPRRMHPRKGSN